MGEDQLRTQQEVLQTSVSQNFMKSFGNPSKIGFGWTKENKDWYSAKILQQKGKLGSIGQRGVDSDKKGL